MRTSIDRRAWRAMAGVLGMALCAATAAAETSDGQGTGTPPATAVPPGGSAQTPPAPGERPKASLRVGLVPPLYRNGAGQIVDPRLGTPIPGQGDPK